MICGKLIYLTRQAAIDYANGLRSDKSNGGRRPDMKEVYFCEDCKGWHCSTGGKTARIRTKKRHQVAVNNKKEVETKGKVAHKDAIEHVLNKEQTLIIHGRNFKIK